MPVLRDLATEAAALTVMLLNLPLRAQTEAAADVAPTVMLLSLPLTCPLSCVEPTGILTL